jgi:arylsulfatase
MHRTAPINLGLGRQRLTVRITVRPDLRWNVLLTDGVAVVDLNEVPQLVGMAPFTGISVGADRGGPVDWELTRGRGSYGFSGVVHSVTYTPAPYSSTAPAERARVWAEGAHLYD